MEGSAYGLTSLVFCSFMRYITNLDKFVEFHSLETAIHTFEVFNVENLFNITYVSPLT